MLVYNLPKLFAQMAHNALFFKKWSSPDSIVKYDVKGQVPYCGYKTTNIKPFWKLSL